jgi:hypothetical protein
MLYGSPFRLGQSLGEDDRIILQGKHAARRNFGLKRALRPSTHLLLLFVLAMGWELTQTVHCLNRAAGTENDIVMTPTPAQATSRTPATLHGRSSSPFLLTGFYGFDGDEYDSLDELRANVRRSRKTIDSLLVDLSRDGKPRLLAIMALGGKGAEAKTAVPRLETMLRDPNEEIRLEAAIALGRIGPDAKPSLPLLEKLLHDDDPAVRTAAAQAIASVCWRQGFLCQSHDVPASVIKNGKTVLLNIGPREDALDHPPEGWCAETAIQEALLYFGAYYPQKAINAAGRPEHPDLYSNEIPTALKNLHVAYEMWPSDKPNQKLDEYMAWVRLHIAAGNPVFVGLKLFPTEHDEWSLDHFSLVVGTDGRGMLVNTAWGYREPRTETQLTSEEEGLSFWNKYREYFGLSLNGLVRRTGMPSVRLFVCSETNDTMNVAVKCENLEPGRSYLVSKSKDASDSPGTPWITFDAKEPTAAIYDQIDKHHPCVYWCQQKAEIARK